MIKLPDNYHNPACYWAQLMTLRCNGKCPYCILNRRGTCVPRPDELSGKQILDFWNNLERKEGRRLSLIGGETTLHRDFVEIVNNLEGYAITVTTNCKGPFFAEPDFYKKLKPKPSSTLRINTTFHPHHMTSDEYIAVIKQLRRMEYFVDQTAYVLYPDYPKEHQEAVKRVADEIKITDSPYMGFWNKEKGFDAEPCPENNEMKPTYLGESDPAELCGIIDYEAYIDMCGQPEPRQAICRHPLNALLIDPAGWSYPCHFRLYYAIDPFCHIDEFRPVAKDDMTCDWYGFCNHCDVPHVGCFKNPTAKEIEKDAD